jgi:acyl dehydratase
MRMAMDRQKLLDWPFPDREHAYSERDTILYALGVGFGADPAHLPFVYEKNLRALPTLSVVLGYPGFWLGDPATGVDWKKVLHGEQGVTIMKPLPAKGRVVGRTRVTDIFDKGRDKGAFLYSRRDVFDLETGDLLCRLTSTTVLRGDGGCGGPSGPVPPPQNIPERPADLACELSTSARAALVYRLSGDWNPLHADPAVARSVGFERPILHGLCTFGVVGHALLRAVCDYQPERLRSMNARFSAPVYPGETIRTEMWKEAGAVAFRASVVERPGTVVLNNGRAELD